MTPNPNIPPRQAGAGDDCKLSRFLPYHVRVFSTADTAGKRRWFADWYGREYRPLHAAPIALARKPQERALRSITQHADRLVDERDGSLSVYLPSPTFLPDDPGRWRDYADRLRRLLHHLEPDPNAPGNQDACDPPNRRPGV